MIIGLVTMAMVWWGSRRNGVSFPPMTSRCQASRDSFRFVVRQAYCALLRCSILFFMFVVGANAVERLPQASRPPSHFPNVHLQLSQGGLDALTRRHARREIPIEDIVGGSWISGHGEAEVQGSAHLVPSPHQAAIRMQVDTLTRSLTSGTQSAAIVHSVGHTSLSAMTMVTISEFGCGLAPVHTKGHTQSEQLDFRWGRRVGHYVAKQQAESQRGAIEAELNRRAQARLNAEFEQEVAFQVADIHAQFDSQFYQRLRRDGLLQPGACHFSTTTKLLKIAATITDGNLSAAPYDAPSSGTNHDVVLTCHESALNNILHARLAGRELAEADWADAFQSLVPLPINPITATTEGSRDWTVTLVDHQPLQFVFHDQQCEIRLRAKQFWLKEQTYPAANLTVRYRLTIGDPDDAAADPPQPDSPRAVARFIREDRIEIEIPSVSPGTRVAVRQQVFRSLLRQRFEPFFEQSWELRPSSLAAGPHALLQVADLDLERGWMFIYADVIRLDR